MEAQQSRHCDQLQEINNCMLQQDIAPLGFHTVQLQKSVRQEEKISPHGRTGSAPIWLHCKLWAGLRDVPSAGALGGCGGCRD
jgi:hypothetical protein